MNEKLGGCLIFIAMLTVTALIGTLITMWLWNWLLPALFELPEINFWVAFGVWLFIVWFFNRK